MRAACTAGRPERSLAAGGTSSRTLDEARHAAGGHAHGHRGRPSRPRRSQERPAQPYLAATSAVRAA
eukprot:scaffold51568_cov36-Phaeocystis_antarctica.AAC.1